MTSSIETGLTLALIGHLYDHTGTAAGFKQTFKLLNTPDLSLAVNGQGASAITLELEAPLSGGNAAPAAGDILTLTQDGGDGSVIFKGIVEDFPDFRGDTTSHEILVNPVGVQLGDTPFETNYTVATDTGQMARDIVAACPNLTSDATSIPLSGITAIFSFAGQSFTCLTALDELRKISGVNFYYWPDTSGKVWFRAVNTANPATHSIMVAPQTSLRKFTAPVSSRKNIVKGFGAVLANATAPLSATYDNSAGSPLGKRELVPALTYSQLTDLTTLQNIVNTVGSALDRPIVNGELDIENYATRIQPGDTLRYYEENVNERIESAAGAGAFSPTYVVLSVQTNGPKQSVAVSDIPITLDDLKYLIDGMIARASVTGVSAVQAGSTQTITPVMIGTAIPSTPATPTLATAVDQLAQANNSRVTVSWIANPGGDLVDTYQVRWRQGAGPYQYLDSAGALSLTIHGLLPGTSYGFSVAATNSIGNISAFSAEATIVTASDASAPAVPTGLAAVKTPRGALVSWTANTEADLQGYDLQVSIGGGAFNTILSKTLVTSFAYVAPSGTALGTSLQFKVRALDWTNNASAFSAASTAVNTDGIVFDELLAGNVKVFGTLTTGGLQTAASGARVIIDSTSIRISDGTATNYGAPSGAGITAELKNDGTAFFKGTVSASSVYGSTIATAATTGTTGNAGFKLSGQFLDFYTIGATPEGNRYWFAPDNVTAFTLSGELAAATTTFNPPADSVTSTISGLGANTVTRKVGVLQSFKKSGTPALVGVAGALATGTTSVIPAFGQATTAGHLLVLIAVAVGSSANSWSGATGYTNINSWTASDTSTVLIFVKENCGAGETAPTLSVPGATKIWAQLTEWSGEPTSGTPDKQHGSDDATSGASFSLQVTDNLLEPEADVQAGELVISAVLWRLSGATTATIADVFNNATATTLASDTASSLADHIHFSYGITSWATVATAKVLQLTNFVGFEEITTGAANNNARGHIVSQYSNDTAGALITLRKAKGTATSPLAVDTVLTGLIHSDAYDGSAWVNTGKLGFFSTYQAPGEINGTFFVEVADNGGIMQNPLTVDFGFVQFFQGKAQIASDGSGYFGGPISAAVDQSGATAPTNWGTVPVKLDEQTPTGNSFTFASIPQGFSALMIVFKANSAGAGAAALNLTLNGDALARYDWAEATCSTAGAVTGVGGAAATSIRISVVGKTGDAGCGGVIFIPAYAIAIAHNITAHSYRKDTTLSGALNSGGFYNQSVALTSVTFTINGGANFENSHFEMWGIP